MASKFWVGGGTNTNWNSSPTTNWANSSGGAGNQTAPGSSDMVVFDGASGTGNSVISANITVQGLECDGSTLGTGTYGGTITHNNAVTLTINTGAANSLRFTAGMNYTPASNSSTIAFTHTSGTASIKSAGKQLGSLLINGTGGTTSQVDALLVNAVQNALMTLTLGTFTANGQATTVIQFASNNGNTRALTLGSSWTAGGNATVGLAVFGINNTAGLTFTKGTCDVTILAPTSNIQSVSWNTTGNLVFNNLILNQTSNNTVLFFQGGSVTFNQITVNSGWDLQLLGGQTLTLSNAFTWTGTQANPILVFASTQTGPATLSCGSGTCTLNWGGLAGITASGGASFVATNVFNFGTNAGWSITPPCDSSTSGLVSSIWRDTTAADFTVANSIGKSIMNGVSLGTGLTINAYTGDTPQTGDAFNIVKSGGAGDAAAIKTKTDQLTFTVSNKIDANVLDIGGDATAATNLTKSTKVIGRGTCTTGGTTTSVPTSAFTPAGIATDQFKGRSIIFDVDTTTTALRGQQTTITASSISATPTFTVDALTTAPANGDVFGIY